MRTYVDRNTSGHVSVRVTSVLTVMRFLWYGGTFTTMATEEPGRSLPSAGISSML